jgi:hypothetical protein
MPLDPLTDARATVAMRTEDLRIARKHHGEALERGDAPSVESSGRWVSHLEGELDAATSALTELEQAAELPAEPATHWFGTPRYSED